MCYVNFFKYQGSVVLQLQKRAGFQTQFDPLTLMTGTSFSPSAFEKSIESLEISCPLLISIC